MSITRLQQARQMYALGQRVAKTLDGSRPGYRGDDAARSERSYSGNNTSRADPGNAPQGDGPARGGSAPDRNPPPAPVISNNPMDIREQVRLGNPVSKIGTVVYNAPDFTKVGPGSTQHNNFIDALNLQGSTYKPVNIPSFIPGSTLLNTVGNFIGGLGHKRNTQFFAENVAGKYGYGYSLDDYKQYMSDRMSGKVGAYGNVEQGQNTINARGDNSSGGRGIMDLYNTVSNTDTNDTTTDFEFVSRFLQSQPDDIREEIESKMQNYYTV